MVAERTSLALEAAEVACLRDHGGSERVAGSRYHFIRWRQTSAARNNDDDDNVLTPLETPTATTAKQNSWRHNRDGAFLALSGNICVGLRTNVVWLTP